MNKKKKLIILLGLIVIIIVSLICVYFFFIKNKNKDIGAIIAEKTETVDGEKRDIKYTIEINGYDIERIIKEITFETKEEAEQEYHKYEIINKYERREIGLELKNKKLILNMPEKQLKLDIEYDEVKDIVVITGEGEQIGLINKEHIIECLQAQGYTIK